MIENYSFFQGLIDLDRQVLIIINHLGAPFMDGLWLYMSRMESWLPLYGLLVLLFYHIWGWKKAFFITCFIGLLILCSDQSANLSKNFFKRLRPCKDPVLSGQLRLIQGSCRGLYGFFSAHSANHFALALFLSKLLRSFGKHLSFLLILWASLVAYSRIYLAAHYPLDVLTGIGVGIIFGYFFGKLCHKKLGLSG